MLQIPLELLRLQPGVANICNTADRDVDGRNGAVMVRGGMR